MTTDKITTPDDADLFAPPHPVWNSPANVALGKLLKQIEDTREAIDEFVEEVGEFPAPMFTEFGDEFITRLRALSLVMGDQHCQFDSNRRLTSEENAAWRASHKASAKG